VNGPAMSEKRDYLIRHCEEQSDEAIQLSFRSAKNWIASLRSQ